MKAAVAAINGAERFDNATHTGSRLIEASAFVMESLF